MPAPAIYRDRLALAETLIDRVDFNAAAERIRQFAESGTPHQIVTVNLDFLSIAERDPQFRVTINGADLAVADGMPLVWLSRLIGQPLPERVTGVELVQASCEYAARSGRRVFLLGAAPGVADTAAKRLQVRHPGLTIAGVHSPPMGPISNALSNELVSRIRASEADFLFVALGAPRQDIWIREHLEALQVPVAMGVGCVLDLLAGVSRRAPTWMQRAGLEWAFRLGREPGRLWRRYLLNDLPMLGRLMLSAAHTESPATEELPA
jgi:N-acetylglucosaminyldiphosphoundecaprenol N-acetyl-beta-D-mannosaminyltransferase